MLSVALLVLWQGSAPSGAPSSSPSSGTPSSSSPGSSPSSTQGKCPCNDQAPDTTYTCDQQKKYGKCDSSWMSVVSDAYPNAFCARTCGRCPSTC